jgi:hypothetical protein
MKRMLLSAALLTLVTATGALAQQPASATLPQVNVSGSPGEQNSAGLQSVAPEVWVYMQERNRYEDPKQAVRRKAEARALARQGRLEARRWYGLSNSRPTAAATPFMSQYSPAWRGNGGHGYDWIGTRGTVAIHIDAESIRR